MTKTIFMAVATLAIAVAGCKKDEKAGEPTTEDTTVNPCGDTASKPAADAAAAPVPAGEHAHVPTDPEASFVVAKVAHVGGKPGDPVHVVFDEINVKKVDMKDTGNLEGATAEIEIDLSSIKSGIPDRDTHLASPDFFDSSKNSIVTVNVDKVKKAGDNKYNAEATISFAGTVQTWPVSFEVVSAEDDSVRVKGTHNFKRTDFKVGQPAGEEGPADEVELELHMTLAKS
jgi:polyisoprenoid-binding protein YceI